jgi:hypothetical protein
MPPRPPPLSTANLPAAQFRALIFFSLSCSDGREEWKDKNRRDKEMMKYEEMGKERGTE